MENIMNGGQLRRKTNSVSHWATDFKDFEWSDISGCQLPFYAETLNTCGRIAEVFFFDKMPYLELQRFSSLICITLLSRLGCLEVSLNNLDLIFSFDN
jgi:hypothetical protein